MRGRHSAIGIPNRRVDNARYPTLINLIFVSRTDVDSVIHDDLTTSEPILLSLIEKRSTFFRFYVSREIRREIRVRRGEREFTSVIYISVLDVDDSFDKGCFKAGVVAISNFSTCYRIYFIALLTTSSPPSAHPS